MEDSLGDHYSAVRNAEKFALQDGRKSQVDNFVKGDPGLVEHLRDDGHRAVRSLADTEGEMSGTTSHSAYDQPVAACAGILIDRPGKVGALILGGIEAEGRCIVRKRKVVVDGLGDMDG